MKFEEFITKWNGKYVDTDNAYGAQCMDLMHQYCVEVLGLGQEILAADPAKLVFLNFDSIKGHELFEKIDNTPTGIPQEGDIVFWDGTFGHVAIFIDGTTDKFNSFDQNYPTGSPCHVQAHNYISPKVLGWLRFKSVATVAVEAPVFENLVRKSTLMDKVAQMLNKEVLEAIIIPDIERLLKLEDTLAEKDKQLSEAQAKAQELETTIAQRDEELKKLQGEISGLKDKIDVAIVNNNSMSEQIEKLKKDCQPAPILIGWRKILYDILMKL